MENKFPALRAIFHKLLLARGIHFLATRFGNKALRKLCFDEKFRSGTWNYKADGNLAEIVTRYALNGDLLMLGCGNASILDDLDLTSFTSITGVDISSEAIQLAKAYDSPNLQFHLADMVSFKCPQKYRVILFAESINYVPLFQRKPLLRSLSAQLQPGGCFIVTISQGNRYANILRMIRRNFNILEDRRFNNSARQWIVFKPAA